MKTDKIDERIRLLSRFRDAELEPAAGLLENALRLGGKILLFGNGGSATQASHFAAELVNKFYLRRRALPAISLASDTAAITSIANDDEFAQVFARQIDALGAADDVAVGITTSGRSANVLEALRLAKSRRMRTVALCGRHDVELIKIPADAVLRVDSSDTPIIQEMHLFMLHTLAEMIERRLSGEQHD